MNTQITRWNPWREMEQMQQRLASLWGNGPLGREGRGETMAVSEWSPKVDITEDNDEILVKAELPEMNKDNVKVTVEDGILTLAGERKHEKEEKDKKYHRIEREYGSFVRCFTLPDAVVTAKVSAEFKEGLLVVHLPKDVKAMPKPIEIKVA